MAARSEELAAVQAELQGVKQALREGGAYLGMKGEPLQRYLRLMAEKENLLISRQLQLLQSSDVPAPAGNGANHVASAAVLASAVAGAAGAAAPVLVPRQLPPGPAKAFDRDSLAAVVAHMQEYEAAPTEATKALRALSSLAYADASKAGNHEEALDQLLRLLLIHNGQAAVQLAGMRALCNMAYDQDVALKRLAAPDVLSALMAAMANSPESKEVGGKASEALARIVAAETCPEDANGVRKEPVVVSGPGVLVGLFLAASRVGPASWQELVPQLITQLVNNEVVELPLLAERFAAAASEPIDAQIAAGWMALARLFCACDLQDLPQLMTDAGAIVQSVRLMEAHTDDAGVQLGGIETMSSLVGNRWAGLQSFADAGGMRSIETAMRTHGSDLMLQTKGIRALASGVQWPEDVQSRSGYSGSRSMELTQVACSQHTGDQELQIAALEALAKYVEKPQLAKEFAAAGGEQLARSSMGTHRNAKKVQSFGKLVLDGLQRIA